MHLLPRTRMGKWSAGLIIAFFLLFILVSVLFAASGQTGDETFSDNLLLAIPGYAAAFCAIGAFITGLIAVFHRGEQAVLAFVSLAVGMAVTLFLAAQFLF